MNRHYLIYGNKPTIDFDVWISGSGTFDAPERDVEMVSIPGRNGDLTFDNGRFNNIEVRYPAFISNNFTKNMEDFRAYAKSLIGYQRLEDTYHPEQYREAILIDGFNPETIALNRGANFEIVFNCKPQRWLKSGEDYLPDITGAITIHNPTYYEAKPFIRVYGPGTFTIGDCRVQITTATEYTDLDCELHDAFHGFDNRNQYVKLLSGKFPSLPPGDVLIDKGTTTKLQIKPRWYTI